jgi:hypothetical protein
MTQAQPERPIVRLFQARLSLRIVGLIFASLLLIATLLLIPSAASRHQELLDQIAAVSGGKVAWILASFPAADGPQLLAQLRLLQEDPMLRPVILGGAVYRADGALVGAFGEPPAPGVQPGPGGSRVEPTSHGPRYDVAWIAPSLAEPYLLALRHDAAPAQATLLRDVLRIAGLVALSAAFVTLVVMLTLGPFLIGPILALRDDLARAGAAIAEGRLTPRFASGSRSRRDELGEVIVTFHAMFQQIAQAVQARHQVEQAQRRYIEQVTLVTNAAAAVERGSFQLDELAPLTARSDELGSLARVFMHMADEVRRRETTLRQQVAELTVAIDQQRRAREVEQITASELFQELRAELSELDLDSFWGGAEARQEQVARRPSHEAQSV